MIALDNTTRKEVDMAGFMITPRDEAHWLEMRDAVITSTVVSALFGLSPYTTRFEAWQHHANGIKLPFISNDRVEKGSRMERYAAEEVGRKEGWEVEPFKDFYLDEVTRTGCSFDYRAKINGEYAVLEIKAVDHFRHRDMWTTENMPEHIEIQLQWQMLCSGYKVGYVAAWTSVYEYTLYRREYDPEMGAALLAAVADFWRSVDNREEPEPDFARDEKIISAMFRATRPDPLDMTADEDFDQLLAKFERWKEAEKEAKKAADAAKAEIHFRLKDAGVAFSQRYKVTAGWTQDTPDRVAEPGEVIKGRAGYRQCLIKDLTAKK